MTDSFTEFTRLVKILVYDKSWDSGLYCNVEGGSVNIIVLYCIVLYRIVSYRIVSYCIVLYCIVLYYKIGQIDLKQSRFCLKTRWPKELKRPWRQPRIQRPFLYRSIKTEKNFKSILKMIDKKTSRKLVSHIVSFHISHQGFKIKIFS